MKKGYVYIATNYQKTTLYTGVTSNWQTRAQQHAQHEGSRFTAQYNVAFTVFVEEHPSMQQAIAREKQIKQWRRSWKIALINEANPAWLDLGTGLPFGSHLHEEDPFSTPGKDPESSSG